MKYKNDEKFINGKWWKINKKIEKKITAKYDKIKDWVIDPVGYFLISIDKKNKLIRVGFCTFEKLKKNSEHNLVAEINGTTAISIVNTIIKHKYILIFICKHRFIEM